MQSYDGLYSSLYKQGIQSIKSIHSKKQGIDILCKEITDFSAKEPLLHPEVEKSKKHKHEQRIR